MSDELLSLLESLITALERVQRKSQLLLADSSLLETETGQDLLNVICMQFLAIGEAIKRLDRQLPGRLQAESPDVDWKGAMGLRDVIAHQYFAVDSEQILLICRQSLPGLLGALGELDRALRAEAE